jgi:hypothetical protein
MSRGPKIAIAVLSVLVLLSLSLNAVLLWQWWQFREQIEEVSLLVRPIVHEALTQSISDLEAFEQSTLQFDVAIEQELPIQTVIPFEETLEVPIETSIPIDEEFSTTVSMFGLPTDVTVPINMEIPIDLDVPVTIDRSIPISATVPLNMDVPISIPVRETEISPYLERLRTSLLFLEETLLELEENYGLEANVSD